MKRALVAVVLLLVLTGCGKNYPNPVGQVRCVDERNQTVDPELCDDLDDDHSFKSKTSTKKH